MVLLDRCYAATKIIIIMHGVIDIVVSDGYVNSHILDILGKDSIIGSNFVLKQEPWCYEALKTYLRERGVHVEFSQEHDYYWTSFVYVAVPSSEPGGKSDEQIDHDP